MKAGEKHPIYCAIGFETLGTHWLALLAMSLSWDHVSDAANMVRLPAWISDADVSIIQSHYQFWRIVSDYVERYGPLRPVKVFKHSCQTLYSITKGGVDGATDQVADVHYPQPNLSFETKFVLRSIFTVCINACIAYRRHTRRYLTSGDCRDFKNLRRTITRRGEAQWGACTPGPAGGQRFSKNSVRHTPLALTNNHGKRRRLLGIAQCGAA